MHRPTRPLPSLAALLACCAAAFAHPAIDAQLADVTRLIAARPGDAALYLQRAQLHEEHGDLDPARADLATARALDTGLAASDLALARLELRAGRSAEALPPADRFLATSPRHAEGLITRARIVTTLDRDDAGPSWLAALDAAEAGGRPQPEIYLEASRILGVAPLDRGLAILGDIPTLVAAAIAADRDAGRLDAALARCRAAREHAAPGSPPEWRVTEGELLALAGRATEARAAFEQSLRDIQALPPRSQASRFVRELAGRARTGLIEDEP